VRNVRAVESRATRTEPIAWQVVWLVGTIILNLFRRCNICRVEGDSSGTGRDYDGHH
jgi:hypothetical protein